MTFKTLAQGLLFAAAGSLITLGCVQASSNPAQPNNPTTIDGLKGYKLRVLHPGEMVSMIYMTGRVNLTIDKDDKIMQVSFY